MSKYTGVVTRTGAGTESVTRNCHLIHSGDQGDDVWVDTMVIISKHREGFCIHFYFPKTMAGTTQR